MLVPPIDRCFPLTAAGPSALAKVRFAGRELDRFIAARLSKPITPGRPLHVELRDDRGIIDDPVAVLRDDRLALDLTLHGGATILAAVRALAEVHGFVWTVPGDRPWDDESLVGIVDAATSREHEFLLALPHARTERAAQTLLAQPAAWDRLNREEVDEQDVLAMLEDRSLEHLLVPPTVAIVGLPNAGKSTLANQLFGTRRSIVSPTAGTTRDWVGEPADLDGLIVTLLDTPGLRQTRDEIERQAIEQSRTPIAQADRVIVLVDATRDDAEQDELLARFRQALRCVNKVDVRLPAWSDERIAGLEATPIAASSGKGIDQLIAAIHETFDLGKRPVDAPRIWTTRQRDTMNAVAQALRMPPASA